MAKISTYPILSTPSLNDLLIGTDVENLNITKNFAIGDIASFIIGGSYVPYVGATGNVNLGAFNITSGGFIVNSGTAAQFLKANGTLDSTVYQPAGNYITQLSGEATASGPGNAAVTLSNAAVIGKVLTGLTITGNAIVATDSILTAFGKVQNQINTLVGGVQYKGTWNAATNTPALVSSVGVSGNYYVVSVAGNTNLNGITDWNLGDWAIFNGSAWEKVDNTDAVISVNGQVGAVVLTTTNIAEGTNLYYTNTRARLAINLTTTGNSGVATYNNTNGFFNIPEYTLAGLGGVPLTRQITINGVAQDLSADRTYNVGTVTSIATTGPLTGGTITGSGTIGITQSSTSTDGYLSSTDWTTFNNKQNTIVNPVTGTGTAFSLPMWSGASSLVNSPLSYLSDTFTFQYNTPTGGTLVFTNSSGTAYAYTIQMNNFGSPRSTVHSYTDGIVVQSIGGVQVSRVFANGNTVFGTGVADNGHKLEITGDLYVSSIVNATTDTDRFLVSDAGVIKYRTGTELRSDIGAGVGSVTSVGLTMPSAFSVANSPITSAGTIAVTGAGIASQYVRGDGTLADFPTSTGGGASVSYYLNGSVSQGTIGGVDYKELSEVPIFGAGTDISIAADGYIASFITDAGDPNLLNIPAGNWNFETYFSASSGGGTPTFYVELYRYDGTTFTLIASSVGVPELISFGTNIQPYFSTLAVPQTALAETDRLAVRYYVSVSGRTITLHTENGHLCQIVTTFSNGLTALNGLTAQVQYFQVGTAGTDFNIASASATHTFNIPDASATARGLVTTGTQIIAGAKTLTSTLNGTNSIFSSAFASNQTSKIGIGFESGYGIINAWGADPSTFGGLKLQILHSNGDAYDAFRIDPDGLIHAGSGYYGTIDAAFLKVGSATAYSQALTPPVAKFVNSANNFVKIALGQGETSPNFNDYYGIIALDNSVNLADNKLRFYLGYDDAVTGTHSNDQLVIQGDGNVGIGTATPSAKLHVTGTSLITGAATFSSSVTANSLIKTGGTSSQFLKADGSVDSSTYLTTSSAASTYVTIATTQSISGVKTFDTGSLILAAAGTANSTHLRNSAGDSTSVGGSNVFGFNSGNNIYVSTQSKGGFILAFNNSVSNRQYDLPNASGTIALTTDLGAYLPLAGGTLTGALNGTSAAFTGAISGSANTITATIGIAGDFTNNSTTNETLRARNNGSGKIAAFRNGSGEVASITNAGGLTLSGALNGTSANFNDNLVLTGASKQVRLENSSFVNFTNSGNTVQRGYIQHDGTNLNIASPVGNITLINALNGTSASFSGKLSVTQASTDFVAEITNTQNATPYGLRIKDAVSGANGYPLLSVSNNAGSVEYFRVNSGSGAATFSSTIAASGRISTSHSTSGDYAAVFYNSSATGEGVTVRGGSTSSHNAFIVQPYNGATTLFNILATGAATFSSSVTATQMAVGNTSFNGVLSVVGNAATNGLTVKSAGNGGTFPFRVTWASGTDGDMLCVNDAGNVGIGTTSPDIFGRGDAQNVGISVAGASDNMALQLNAGGSAGRGAQIYMGQGGTRHFTISSNASESRAGTTTNTPFILTTNDTTRLTIAASTGAATFSSSVGIGTTPVSGVALDIRNNSTTTIADMRNANSAGFGPYIAAASGGNYSLRIADYQNNTLFSVFGSGEATFSSSVTAASGVFSLATTGGSIGSVKNLTLANTSATLNDFAGINFAFYNNGTNFGYIGSILSNENSNGAADLVFGVKASNAATSVSEYMRIKFGGNVGIGTDSPGTYDAAKIGTSHRFLNVQSSSSAYAVATLAGNQSSADSRIGYLTFVNDNNSSSYKYSAWLGSEVEGSTANQQGGRLIFSTSADASSAGPIERMRITSGGFLKASNTGTYHNIGATYHELRTGTGGQFATAISNTGSSPFGLLIDYNSAPNNSTSEFLYCTDGIVSTLRAAIRSNGGLSNFQANNTNLSDERTKKDIEPLESYWDKFKAIEIVKFKYKDQTHDDFNIGVIAQQVESVAPEFVDVDGWNTKPELDEEGNEIISEEEPLKAIYTADLYHATIKVLQEAMAKIEKLETEIDSLKN